MIDLLKANIRIAALVGVAVALLIGCIVLYLQWQSVDDTQSKLESEKKLAEVMEQNARVEYDVGSLQASEQELLGKAKFPTEFPVVDLSVYLAQGSSVFRGLEITEVGPVTPAGTEQIGGKAYPAYETKVTVTTGELTQITSYLDYIEGGRYTSIKVKDVNVVTSLGGGWVGKFTVVFVSQS